MSFVPPYCIIRTDALQVRNFDIEMSDSKYVIIMEMIDSGYVNTEDLSIQYCLYRLFASLLSYLCNEERYDNWISILNDLSIYIHISFLTVLNYISI